MHPCRVKLIKSQEYVISITSDLENLKDYFYNTFLVIFIVYITSVSTNDSSVIFTYPFNCHRNTKKKKHACVYAELESENEYHGLNLSANESVDMQFHRHSQHLHTYKEPLKMTTIIKIAH